LNQRRLWAALPGALNVGLGGRQSPDRVASAPAAAIAIPVAKSAYPALITLRSFLCSRSMAIRDFAKDARYGLGKHIIHRLDVRDNNIDLVSGQAL
jgi:hypothetical protein